MDGWIDLFSPGADVTGPPNSEGIALFRTDDGRIHLDTIEYDEDGLMFGKYGGGILFCTHIRVIQPDEIPTDDGGIRVRNSAFFRRLYAADDQ